MSNLLDNYKLGNLELKNRMVMAPLTRSRADANLAPQTLNATYYAQRASAGAKIRHDSRRFERIRSASRR